MLRALIYVPRSPHSAQWWKICTEHCARHRYLIVAVVSDWDAIEKITQKDRGYVVVAARRDHIPPDRLPRLEVVTEPETAAPLPSRVRPQRTVRP